MRKACLATVGAILDMFGDGKEVEELRKSLRPPPEVCSLRRSERFSGRRFAD